MKRSDMVSDISIWLWLKDQNPIGSDPLWWDRVADELLTHIEEKGMVPPSILHTQPIPAADASISFYTNEWEDEMVILPVGINPVGK